MNILNTLLRSAWLPLALAGAVAAGSGTVAAQTYPASTIRIIAPSPAGGGTDLIARLLARHLQTRLGKTVIVENKAGAAGLLGSMFVARAPSDGSTLLITYQVHVVNPSLIREMPFDAYADFTPITQIVTLPTVLVVNAGLPVKSAAELVALAKSKPGSLNFGSAGRGSNGHLIGELFKQQAGIDTQHVAYKGSAPMAMDLVGGTVQYAVDTLSTMGPHITSGKLRALLITSDKRSPQFPDIPTAAEAGFPKLEAYGWYGLFAPKDTPPAITKLLHHEIVEILKIPEVRDALAATGSTPAPSQSPEAYRAYIKSEIDRWAQVVKAANIAPE